MKFPEIYAILHQRAIDKCSVGFKMTDISGWKKKVQSLLDHWRPLWIIVEDTASNKRIWITKNQGDLEITTANLSLDVNSREYYDTQVRAEFRNQKQMAEYLRKLFESESEAVT